MQTSNAVEIFRLRREHKKKKLQEKIRQVAENSKDKKPELKMQLQETSSMNIGVGLKAQTGVEFVEVVNSIDNDRAEKGKLEDEIRDLQKKTNFSQNTELNEAAKAAI